jgi:hypothetical protein
LLQVTVCDVASGILGADQVSLHVGWEGVSPAVGALPVMVEVHSTHASSGRIGGSQQGGLLGHQFGQASGAGSQAGGQPAKGIQVGAHERGDAHSVVSGLVLGHLKQGRLIP